VKSICLLNVVIKQEILINTHKTKQATSCRVTCNWVPFITRTLLCIYWSHDKTSLYTIL